MARARKKKDEEQQEQVEETPAEPTAEEAPPAEESPAAEEAAPAAEEAPAEEAPVSEEPAAPVEPVAEQPPAPAPRKRAKPKAKKAESLPKKKRAASRARGTGERKPIVRLPKPEHARGRRKERRGTVVSSAMDKTIVVRVDTSKPHPRYKKVVRRSTKVHAHDEANAAGVGDVVRIVETRPLSRTKRWRLAEVMEVAK